jgi:hypothetical protein
MKNKIKLGDFLVDDCWIVYKVIDLLPNSVIVQPQDGCKDEGCEIITFECIENEGWKRSSDVTVVDFLIAWKTRQI